MTEICTRYAAGPDSPLQNLFTACPDCGHTGSAHPSAVNPAVTECQICCLAVALEEFRDAGQSWINMIANAITAPVLEHATEHQNDPHGVIPIDSAEHAKLQTPPPGINDPQHVAYHPWSPRKPGRMRCAAILPNGECCGALFEEHDVNARRRPDA